MRYLFEPQRSWLMNSLEQSPLFDEGLYHFRIESLDEIDLSGILSLEALQALVALLTELAPQCPDIPDPPDPFA